jgi:cation diffusion facilitator CzcD-associated flavoprotein CzcO
VRTDRGERVTARYCIMATGCISTPPQPDVQGLGRHSGKVYHTGEWPHEGADFSGQRVAVIGTGSSGIQAIPVIAQQAAQLTVYQRTPNYSLPSQNGPMTPEYERSWNQNYAALREEQRHTPKLLAPKTYPIGTKRICIDSGYFETFNRDNVELVDISATPIERMTPRGLEVDGRDRALDSIVFATGFDAMGPSTYLGLMTEGFPNLFMITGPGSPSVLSNMMVSIEQHVDFVCDCITRMRCEGADLIEPERAAEDDWVEHVNDTAHGTLFPRANSCAAVPDRRSVRAGDSGNGSRRSR